MSYHISEDGTPRECTASVQDCPIGEFSHFDTYEEAQIHFERINTDKLFKTIVNQPEDPPKPKSPSELRPGELRYTSEESEALTRMEELEKAISAHKHNRKIGLIDHQQKDVIHTRADVAAYSDENEVQQAWSLQDYDRIRLIYANAHSKLLDEGPDTFRFTPEELVQESFKN